MALLTPGGTKYLVAVALAVLVLSSGAFAINPTRGDRLAPADFDDTITTGMTYIDVRQAEAKGFHIPKAQVYYSQYRYVVGYYGIETAASELSSPASKKQFGDPLVVYVTDFAPVTPVLTDDGYLSTERNRATGWVEATDAYYVFGSEARTPTGPIAVPFSDRADAASFAEQYGGEVLDWQAAKERSKDTLDAAITSFEQSADTKQRWADTTARERRALLDRPVSVTVGDDAPTVQAAIDAAPPNTTVRIPAGTYDVTTLNVEKPITLSGVGDATHIRGDRNLSVFEINHSRVAVSDLRISGVGDVGSRQRPPDESTLEQWDATVQLAYGYGDAAIVFEGSPQSLVHDVNVTTPSSGAIVRNSDGLVFENNTVYGSERPEDGFMGVVLIKSRSLVENSTFVDGRDGVYTHRSHETVVRNNSMSSVRYGVHEMYTSDTLLANNTVRDAQTGLVIMTRPVGNLVVGNDIRGSTFGIIPAGSASYFAENTLVDNEYGIEISAARSIYVRNTVVGNDVGARASTIFPTNWVVNNDFVGNDHYATAGLGPLRTWSQGDDGNYWGTLPMLDRDGDGRYDRAFQPTGAVDSKLGTHSEAQTLARSPAMTSLRRLQDTISGLRSAGVVDTAPRTDPVRPEALRQVNATNTTQTTNTANT